jgi:hypothetical protein
MFIPKIILVINMDDKKERSTSSTFLFPENNSSSSIKKEITIESPMKPNENGSVLKRNQSFESFNENNIHRSYSSPLS